MILCSIHLFCNKPELPIEQRLAVANGFEGSRSFDYKPGLTGIAAAHGGERSVKLALQIWDHNRNLGTMYKILRNTYTYRRRLRAQRMGEILASGQDSSLFKTRSSFQEPSRAPELEVLDWISGVWGAISTTARYRHRSLYPCEDRQVSTG